MHRAQADLAEQGEAEKTVVALSQKIASLDGRSRMIRTRLDAEKAPAARVRLIGVLGMVGDPTTLPVLRTALRDESPDTYDAAVRALAISAVRAGSAKNAASPPQPTTASAR